MGKDLQGKIKIFHICSWYPNRVVLNDGNFIHKHIRSINKFTESYILAVYEDPDINKPYEMVQDETDGVFSYIFYHSVSCNRIFKILKRFYYYFKGYFLLKRKFGKPDLIHAHVFLFGGIFAWMISSFQKIPFIVSEHSNIYSNKVPFIKLQLMRFSAKKSKFILPVSEGLKNKISTLDINGNFKIVPNVVNTSIFKPEIKHNEVFEFLHISSFSEEKNIPGLLRAIKKLTLLRSDFHFTIAGDGDIKIVEKLKNDFQIEDRFLTLKGKLSENEVAENMKNCDGFILFSNDETFGIVIAESLSCGIPVITTNLPNIEEFKKGNGLIIIEPKNELQLIDSMIYIIDNASIYNPNLLHKFCVDNFSEQIIGKNISEIYKSAIST